MAPEAALGSSSGAGSRPDRASNSGVSACIPAAGLCSIPSSDRKTMALWFAVYPTGACVTDRTEIRGIVGIGASAGGLEALAELVAARLDAV